jgi:hypothetical protein
MSLASIPNTRIRIKNSRQRIANDDSTGVRATRATIMDFLKTDVLVVGAGPAGLTASALLARVGVNAITITKYGAASPGSSGCIATKSVDVWSVADAGTVSSSLNCNGKAPDRLPRARGAAVLLRMVTGNLRAIVETQRFEIYRHGQTAWS